MISLGALLIGAAVGVLTGLFGVGGGFLITPLLNAVLGVPMAVAVGTGAAQVLGVSSAGLYSRRHEGLTDYKMAVVLLGGNYVGVQVGAATLSWLGELGTWALPGGAAPIVDVSIMAVFVVMLSAIAAWLIYDTSRRGAPDEPERNALFGRLRIPPFTAFQSVPGKPMSLPVMSYFGLAMGFLTGLLGIGGGVVLVPALIYLVGMRTHCAAATSLAMVWLTSFLATIAHAARGNVDLALAVPLLVGGSIGLQVGLRLCRRLSGGALRRYFSWVVVLAALIVLGKLIDLVF